MTESSAFLYLLQVASASFPIGSFSHSYGLETLIQDGRITNAEDLADLAGLWLRYGVAASEGGAVGLAFQATRGHDFSRLAAVDEVLTALKLTRETREASIKIGHAFLRTVASTFDWESVARYRRATVDGRCAGDAAGYRLDAARAAVFPTLYVLTFSRLEDKMRKPVRVGVGGPVGSGKTALVDRLGPGSSPHLTGG